ncbi:hypothetical protein SCG7086_BT_00130 [Chlamydiales bacterium SCGC AG-110-P3]|nr:hypothetical protein SCG7086_BT_00130 [Chlamydiales bacterium SCGC AG-110-P3]
MISRKREVFPEPDDPKRVTISPDRILSDNALSTKRVGYEKERSLIVKQC